MKCKYCGFDSMEDSMVANGAPCGYKGCTHFTCCMDTWYDHMERDHGVKKARKYTVTAAALDEG